MELVRLRGDQGQGLVETVSMIPVVLLLMVAIASLAIWMTAESAVEQAAAAAAVASLEGSDPVSAASQSAPKWARGALRTQSLGSRGGIRVSLMHLPAGPWVSISMPEATLRAPLDEAQGPVGR